jgi:carboxypeptidase Taq
MPPGGADGAGPPDRHHLASWLRRNSPMPSIGRLLDELEPWAEQLPYDSDEASLVRVTRREYERALKVPPAFLAEFSSHSAASFSAWAAARPAE